MKSFLIQYNLYGPIIIIIHMVNGLMNITITSSVLWSHPICTMIIIILQKWFVQFSSHSAVYTVKKWASPTNKKINKQTMFGVQDRVTTNANIVLLPINSIFVAMNQHLLSENKYIFPAIFEKYLRNIT